MFVSWERYIYCTNVIPAETLGEVLFMTIDVGDYEQVLKVISFIVEGILNPIKRSPILSKIKRENAGCAPARDTLLHQK